MTKQIPTTPQRNELPASDMDADPETLCVNWRQGCNGITDDPQDGRLTFCDECSDDSESLR